MGDDNMTTNTLPLKVTCKHCNKSRTYSCAIPQDEIIDSCPFCQKKNSMSADYYEFKPLPAQSFDCHYCGMPAKSFGFFDEPVCKQCGA